MPELPEVETIRRGLLGLVGKTFARYEALWPRQAVPDATSVQAALEGRALTALTRRGKHLLFLLEGGAAIGLHLRMSGRLECVAPGEAARETHVRGIFTFTDGTRLLFADARKFGRVTLLPDLAAFSLALGPEPLDDAFTPAVLRAALARTSRPLKAALLDQTLVAGIGNIYADEALFRARLHPRRAAGSLTSLEAGRLVKAIRAALEDGIAHNGTSFDWIYPGGHMQDHLAVYGRTGEPCPRCGTRLERIIVAQRGTHFCPRCQKA